MIDKRNKKSFQESEEALTSIVITVMLIGIIMGLIIGPILTIQIPNEIRENEALHMDDVSESFVNLRGTINTLIQERELGLNAPTRINLGTRTNNFLDVGSTGTVFIEPYSSQITIFDTEDNRSIFAMGSGRIGYESDNIYFPEQTYIYENNGIVVVQRSRASVKSGPKLEIIKSNATNNLSLSMTIVHIVGNPSTLGGSKSQIIQTTLLAAETNNYNWVIPENVTIKMETSYPQAWQKYYDHFLSNITGLDNSSYQVWISQDAYGYEYVNVEFIQVNYLSCEIAVVDTKIV